MLYKKQAAYSFRNVMCCALFLPGSRELVYRDVAPSGAWLNRFDLRNTTAFEGVLVVLVPSSQLQPT